MEVSNVRNAKAQTHSLIATSSQNVLIAHVFLIAQILIHNKQKNFNNTDFTADGTISTMSTAKLRTLTAKKAERLK